MKEWPLFLWTINDPFQRPSFWTGLYLINVQIFFLNDSVTMSTLYSVVKEVLSNFDCFVIRDSRISSSSSPRTIEARRPFCCDRLTSLLPRPWGSPPTPPSIFVVISLPYLFISLWFNLWLSTTPCISWISSKPPFLFCFHWPILLPFTLFCLTCLLKSRFIFFTGYILIM